MRAILVNAGYIVVQSRPQSIVISGSGAAAPAGGRVDLSQQAVTAGEDFGQTQDLGNPLAATLFLRLNGLPLPQQAKVTVFASPTGANWYPVFAFEWDATQPGQPGDVVQIPPAAMYKATSDTSWTGTASAPAVELEIQLAYGGAP